jgi:hypothetical protein
MKLHVHIIPVALGKPLGTPATQGPLPKTLFHYTTGLKLRSIINSGVIKPSTAHIEPQETPVVWFSSRQSWEPTATKVPVPGKLGQLITANAQGGLARISVPASVSPYSFREIHRVAGTSLQTCAGLIMAGLDMGADPHDWHFTPKPVPASFFRQIEFYDFQRESWLAVDLAELASRN